MISNVWATTYYTLATDNWDAQDIWNTDPDGVSGSSYTSDVNVDDSGNSFVILSGGEIILNFSINAVSLSVLGVLIRDNDNNNFNGVINVFGEYKHLVLGGTIPTANWDVTSKCSILGNGTATFLNLNGLSQNFGDLAFNLQANNAVKSMGSPNLTVSGTFNIISTGGGSRSISFNGANLVVNNFNLQTGILSLNGSNLYVSGDFLRAGGTIANRFGNANIIFNKSGTQTFGLSGSGNPFNGIISVQVNPASILDFSGSTNNLSLGANQTLTILGSLNTGSKTLTANGTNSNIAFLSGSTLKTSNSGGVSSTILVGSGTRSFNNNVSYEISNSGNANFVNPVINGLTIAGSNPVSLTSNITITGDLVVNQQFNPEGFDVLLNGNISGSGNLNQGTGSSTFTFNGNSSISSTGTSARNFNRIVIGPAGTLTGYSGTTILTNSFLCYGTYVPNNGLFKMEQNTSKTILGGNFYDLTIDPVYTSQNITYQGTIGIGNTWTPSLASNIMEGTINFNKVGNQSINSGINYNSLQISGSGVKTLLSSTNISSNLTIGSGTTLSIGGLSIDLGGNLTSNGAIDQALGVISLTGINNQIISGNTSLNNLSIFKPTSGDVTISSPSSVTGFLNIVNLSGSNKLNTNGNLTLVSTASQTASLIDFSTAGSGGSVNGNLTIQRFSKGISPTVGHFYSSPITNASFTVITQTGFQTLMYSEDGNPARINMNFSGAYRRVVESSLTTMTPGRGFSTVQPLDKTIQFVGVPNNGNVTYNLTYNTTVPGSVSGWNMIGNPYPSAIDWGNVDKVGGISAAYLYSVTGYVTLVNAPNNFIPSGQGFFVKATSAAPLVFKNADRVSNVNSTSNNIFYRTAQAPKYLYLDLESKISGLVSKDAAIFSYKSDANDDFDQYDAEKIFNPSPLANVYTQIGNKYLVLNVFNDSSFNKTIPLYVSVRTHGSYQFSLRNLNEFYPNVKVLLHDTENPNSPIDLSSNSQYSFDYTTFTGSRFKISFVDNAIDDPNTIPGVSTTVGENIFAITDRSFAVDQVINDGEIVDTTETSIVESTIDNSFKIFGNNNKVHIVSLNEGENTIEDFIVYDVMGSVILNSKYVNMNNKSAIFDVQRSGVLIVKFTSKGKVFTQKIVL